MKQVKQILFGGWESDFKYGDLLYKKFLWEVKKSERWLEKKNGEDESVKRSNVELLIVYEKNQYS